MTEHIAGRPVSAGTYQKGCRCDGCREAANANQRRYRRRQSQLKKGRSYPDPIWLATGDDCHCGAPLIDRNGTPTCAVYGQQHNRDDKETAA